MRARLLVLAAAVLFSTGGAAIKSTTLTAWQVASFRSGIAALAMDLGFSSHSHFSSAFRHAYGRTPAEFQRSIRSRRG